MFTKKSRLHYHEVCSFWILKDALEKNKATQCVHYSVFDSISSMA